MSTLRYERLFRLGVNGEGYIFLVTLLNELNDKTLG